MLQQLWTLWKFLFVVDNYVLLQILFEVILLTVTEQHKRCVDVIKCLFQRCDFTLTIKVFKGQISLLPVHMKVS